MWTWSAWMVQHAEGRARCAAQCGAKRGRDVATTQRRLHAGAQCDVHGMPSLVRRPRAMRYATPTRCWLAPRAVAPPAPRPRDEIELPMSLHLNRTIL